MFVDPDQAMYIITNADDADGDMSIGFLQGGMPVPELTDNEAVTITEYPPDTKATDINILGV